MCAAPKGNKFWELRSSHGREKIFKTPEILWEAACAYFTWCEEHPLIEIDFKGTRALKKELPKMRAFTLQALCLYLDCNTGYFKDFEAANRNHPSKKAKDFSTVITRIKETIYAQKYTGAAAGFLNQNIIARDLGLQDKTQVEHSGHLNQTIVTKEEAKKIASDLENSI